MLGPSILSTLLVTAAGAAQSPQAARVGEFVRRDYFVTSEHNVRIHVREVRTLQPAEAHGVPVLCLHGGGGAGVASFDVAVPGYSLAEDLARAGHTVYVMDARGFGESSDPPDLNDSSPTARSSVTADKVARDVDAVIENIRRASHARKVAVFGWASGGHWLGFYTAHHADKVSHLIMLNALYGVNAPWNLREAFADKDDPAVFNRHAGAYRSVTAQGLVRSWDAAIPVEDKSAWRDPRAADFYVRTTLASDATANQRQPPSVRIPNAFQREAFQMSLGSKLYDAADIRVPTLVIRGSRDHWSRPEDLAALDRELVNASRKKIVTIPDATHFVFIDRAEKGRAQLIGEIVSFLGAGQDST
jgi:pimeloyl-ACP methyl ester carboxylesterase